MQQKNKKKQPTKRTYVYLGLVTMAVVSLLAKPIKHGFSTLEKYLSGASNKKNSLRKNLNLWSEDYPNTLSGTQLEEILNSNASFTPKNKTLLQQIRGNKQGKHGRH